MASLKALKIRIGSVKSTQKITKAMKMVAAAKLRRAQEAAMAGRPYAERLTAVMALLAGRIGGGTGVSPLLAGTGKDQVHLLVVATSERGLAGAFNTNIVRAVRREAEALIAQGKDVSFLIVGRKSRPILQRFYPKAIAGQHDTSEMKTPGYAHAQAITAEVLRRFEAGEFDVAHLAYSNFKSVLTQDPRVDQIIPVKPAAANDSGAVVSSAAVEYEPDEEAILADLLPRNVTVQIYRALLENQAGFYGSQMTAMDNATRNAGDTINQLSIKYNRQRHAAITTELVEIISGAEAL